MYSRSYSSEGVVLAKRNLGEADIIITLFAKNIGKASLLAKGVRLPKSRKRGHIEVFNSIKFQATKSKGIDLITEADLLRDFNLVKRDLKRASVAYFLIEVTNKLTQDREPHNSVLELLLNSLSELESGNPSKIVKNKFIKDILVELGFWPQSQELKDPDRVLEEVAERSLGSIRVGRRVLS